MRANKGFLLFEMIAALFVLSVASSIVFSALLTSAAKVREFDNAVTARIIAANHLAKLEHSIREGIPVTPGEEIPIASPMGERLRDFEGWGKIEQFRPGLERVEVVVKWKERRGMKSVKLRSLVAR